MPVKVTVGPDMVTPVGPILTDPPPQAKVIPLALMFMEAAPTMKVSEEAVTLIEDVLMMTCEVSTWNKLLVAPNLVD